MSPGPAASSAEATGVTHVLTSGCKGREALPTRSRQVSSTRLGAFWKDQVLLIAHLTLTKPLLHPGDTALFLERVCLAPGVTQSSQVLSPKATRPQLCPTALRVERPKFKMLQNPKHVECRHDTQRKRSLKQSGFGIFRLGMPNWYAYNTHIPKSKSS